MKILLSNEELLKRLQGSPTDYKDMYDVTLNVGDKVKIYYNLFDDNLSKDKRDTVEGIVRYSKYTDNYYIYLLSPLNINGHVYTITHFKDDEKNTASKIIDSKKYVEKTKFVQPNHYHECIKLLYQNGKKEFLKRIVELYKENQIIIDPKEIETRSINLNDENLKIVFKCKENTNQNMIKKILNIINRNIVNEGYYTYYIGQVDFCSDSDSIDTRIYWLCDLKNDDIITVTLSDNPIEKELIK